jgi:microsomal dipeptidase-like Zn-dependent dipeptidase
MNRREFLAKLVRYGLSAGALSALPVERLFAKEFYSQLTIPIINAHAHLPGDLINGELLTYTFDAIRSAKLCATSFAVLGDRSNETELDPYINALNGIKTVRDWEVQKRVKIVRRPSDIPPQPILTGPIPVILAIEGGDAIGTDLGRLDEFYGLGVRMITLVHGRAGEGGSGDNQIGNDMRRHSSDDENDEGLTEFGYQVVRRMNRLGMIVDVSHASTQTLLDIASCTRAPIIDSHTSMLPPKVTVRIQGRQRLYSEAKAIVKTGGVVCTYPIRDDGYDRVTLEDWAEETKLFKSHFGIQHIGLGTDSGGGLPGFVVGWGGISSVGSLEDAMRSGGLGTLEISAFMSLNFMRVFTRCHAIGQVLSFFKA